MVLEDDVTVILTLPKPDKEGFGSQEEKEVIFFAEIHSIGFRESYQAMRAKVKPEYSFAIRFEDYTEHIRVIDGKPIVPTKVIWNGIDFDILRQYTKGNQMVYLTCGRRNNG